MWRAWRTFTSSCSPAPSPPAPVPPGTRARGLPTQEANGGQVLVEDYAAAWEYGTLPANIRLGRDCYLERRESFERVRSPRAPALVLGDRVRVYTWTAFNLEPGGCMEVGDDSILVGPGFMCAARITLGTGVLLSYYVTV